MSASTSQAPGQSALVLGGGLLGGHVATLLARDGHDTTVFSRSINPWLQAQAAGLEHLSLVRGTIGEHEQLHALIDAADCVFFLAGSSTPAHTDRHAARATLDSVVTGLQVMDLMRESSTRRIVLASSGGTIYGEPTVLPTPEDHPLDPISMHGVNSAVAERYAEYYRSHHGLEVSVLRYSNVYGPGQTGRRGQGVIAAWTRALLDGEPIVLFGGAETTRDFVFADDAARATIDLGFAGDAQGVFNVGSADGASLADVLELVTRETGRMTEVEHRPRRPVDVSATALDCAKLRERIGWTPRTSLVDGVRQSCAWIAEHFAHVARPSLTLRP